MFTGIVTDVGEITSLKPVAQGQLHRMRIACRYDQKSIADGASIACNGVCLTVVASGVDGGKTWFDVDAAAETLAMTTAKGWATGTRLNLERALKIGDELGGHIVAGHADGVATIVVRENLPDMARISLRTTRELARFVATKGSVTLDGVSLTVNTVDDVTFSVLIIPHTLSVTTLNAWRAGSEVNLEVDLMARYAARLSEMNDGGPWQAGWLRLQRLRTRNWNCEMADARRAPLKDQTDVSGARALIVEARFYDDIQDAMLQGAAAELKQAGVSYDVITVTGSLEIPATIAIALDAAEKNGKPYDAAIALGCVIRGDTIHFEIVSMESSRALMDLSVARKLPLGNGIITVNTEEQAWARARVSELNKGGDAARAALAVLRIKRRVAKS